MNQTAKAVLSMGLGFLCIDNSHQVQYISVRAADFIFPFTTFLLVFVLWFFARRGIAHRFLKIFQKRKALIHVFWLLMLFSYPAFAYISCSLLMCVRLDDHLFVWTNPKWRCFGLEHSPYAALAISAYLLLLPLPVILWWRPVHRWPFLKGLIDEATHLYEDSCTWWAALNVLRRLCLPLISALPVGLFYVKLTYFFAVLGLLFVHTIVRYGY